MSLIAMAAPRAAPPHHRSSTQANNQTPDRARRTRLTWPSSTFPTTGSKASAIRTSSTASCQSSTFSAFNVSQTNSPKDSLSTTTAPTVSGSAATAPPPRKNWEELGVQKNEAAPAADTASTGMPPGDTRLVFCAALRPLPTCGGQPLRELSVDPDGN